MDLCSRSSHIAQEPHSVLYVLFVKHIMSGAGLISRTESSVRGTEESQVHASEQSEVRLQHLNVFLFLEGSIQGEALLSHS